MPESRGRSPYSYLYICVCVCDFFLYIYICMRNQPNQPKEAGWRIWQTKRQKKGPCIKEVEIELSTPFKKTISLHPCNSTWSSRNLSNSQKKGIFPTQKPPSFELLQLESQACPFLMCSSLRQGPMRIHQNHPPILHHASIGPDLSFNPSAAPSCKRSQASCSRKKSCSLQENGLLKYLTGM